MGIAGAALATVAAWGINIILLTTLIFNQKNSRFGVFSAFAFDWSLLKRLLRFGVPGSLQFTLDILAFTMFLLLVGRIGALELAVTNIVISINAVTFMPSMGVSQGISVMIGHALGRQDVEAAKRSVWSAIHMLLCYVLMVDLIFIFSGTDSITVYTVWNEYNRGAGNHGHRCAVAQDYRSLYPSRCNVHDLQRSSQRSR